MISIVNIYKNGEDLILHDHRFKVNFLKISDSMIKYLIEKNELSEEESKVALIYTKGGEFIVIESHGSLVGEKFLYFIAEELDNLGVGYSYNFKDMSLPEQYKQVINEN